jgi:hypothetical protein
VALASSYLSRKRGVVFVAYDNIGIRRQWRTMYARARAGPHRGPFAILEADKQQMTRAAYHDGM